MRVPKTPKTQYYLDELMLNKYEALHRAAVLVYHQMQVKGVVLSLPVSDEQQAVGGGLVSWCVYEVQSVQLTITSSILLSGLIEFNGDASLTL